MREKGRTMLFTTWMAFKLPRCSSTQRGAHIRAREHVHLPLPLSVVFSVDSLNANIAYCLAWTVLRKHRCESSTFLFHLAHIHALSNNATSHQRCSISAPMRTSTSTLPRGSTPLTSPLPDTPASPLASSASSASPHTCSATVHHHPARSLRRSFNFGPVSARHAASL